MVLTELSPIKMSNTNINKNLKNFKAEKFDWSLIQAEMKNKLGLDIYESWLKKISFIEENGERGNANIFGGSIAYSLDDKNFFSFETRRNRRLNLTEFYDLVYEYKNDCLTAGIKYKKTYYEDRDLKPSENIFFTITLYPLTTFEQKIDQ